MSREVKAKVRDRRKPGWFRIDDEIIEMYGPEIGCHGIAVYAALAKYADKEEHSYPGLRKLCKELKIGRKKLLQTLSQLQETGLIDIEPGDRVSVNLYTLLDVPKRPKGGSNENQGVVLTRTGGGSEKHQGGGSNENRNQTHKEPDPINQREVQTLSHLKQWTKSKEETDKLISELKDKFLNADASEALDSFAFAVQHGGKEIKNLPLTLRTYFRKSHEWGSGGPQNGKPPPEPQFRGGDDHTSMDEDRKQRIRERMGMAG